MPRLRYYKNYDWLAPGESNDNTNKGAYPNDNVRNKQDYSRDSTESRQYENSIEYEDEDERGSGYNWLSNKAIISSFTNDRIKQAIKHYRALLRLFEAELLQRSFTPSKHPAEDRNTYTKLRREKSRNTSNSSSERGCSDISQLRSMRRILRQLKLSKEEKRKLFEEWNKIQKGAVNND
jgi:hypothetical protein